MCGVMVSYGPLFLSQKQAMARTRMRLSALATALREPIEIGKGTSGKKPMGTDELVEKGVEAGENVAALDLEYEGNIFLPRRGPTLHASALRRRECLETQRLLVCPHDSSSSFPPFKPLDDPEM